MSALVERIRARRFTLIAEIGVNYYDIAAQRDVSPMQAAKLMCLEAKKAGIHAVKFQSYRAESLAAKDSPAYWDTAEEASTSQFELFKKYDSFGEVQYRELADYCDQIGIEFLSTAFDFEAADYLEPMMHVFKISSSDLTNLPFIEYQARKNKPMIMSVGAGDLDEMAAAVGTVRSVNDQPLVLCHCVLEYPTPYSHANLARIASLGDAFPEVILGYSDHCKPDLGADVIKAAYVLGACVIEKHFTLDRSLPGNDHYHAMDPDDARKIISGVEFMDTILGEPGLTASEGEALARLNARRSIVSGVLIPAGTKIAREMLMFKRPGTGVAPFDIERVVGRVAVVEIPEDTPILPEMLG